MADDWQVGDLALCVAVKHSAFNSPSSLLSIGRVYTVARVGRPIHWAAQERALGLDEVRASRGDEYGFPESLFRKIRPHQPDEQDAETIRLLTGAPAIVEA